MLDKIKKFSDLLDKITIRIASLFVAIILIIAVYGAFFRYILGSPLPWPLPIERILMIWSALFGIAAAFKRNQHMGVEGLIKALPESVERVMRYIIFGLIFIFMGTLFWYGLVEVLNNNDTYMITGRLRISSKWLVAAIPVSALIHLVHLFTAPIMIEERIELDLSEELMEEVEVEK
ncbi:MAG: TRAP transporter small permease [Halanaerobiales bacterium]|nr:TRAP transporter small permease [Halanaerobiales bacterium]